MQYYGGSGGGYPPQGGAQQPTQTQQPTQQAPSMTGTAPKKSKAPILVIVFAILAVIMMGISLVLPWYIITSEVKSDLIDSETEISYSFSSLTGKFGNDTETKSWDDEEIKDSYDNQASVYSTIMIFVILGLVFSILFIIGGVLGMKGKGKKLAVIFGLLAFILCLLAPILFMFMHPGAISQDQEDNWKEFSDEPYEESDENGPQSSFMGSESESQGEGEFSYSVEMSWGPSTGWFMAMLGFIFGIIGFGLALRIPKPTGSEPAQMPTSTSVPPPSQPTQQPQQQYGYGNQQQPPSPPQY